MKAPKMIYSRVITWTLVFCILLSPLPIAKNKVDGSNIGIAILDSGIAVTNDFDNRVIAAVDFTGEGTYDYNGHGTHVAGIAAGNGKYKGTSYAGIATNANLINVKVLDTNGAGQTSTVIEGIEWVIKNKDR